MLRDTPLAVVMHRPEMRAALASRDIAGVYRLLQRFGVSQRRIAAMTSQSQSEVSEILGGRQVVSYEVLVRIADGLGVPRGRLGLAYDDGDAPEVTATAAPVLDPESGRWLVRLPVFVDSYGTALRLVESVAPATSSARAGEGGDETNGEVARQWHLDARAVLAGRR